MPFVQGKCENCGGILAVDSSLKAAICPFCGAAYVVQDSINYYNTSIKVENMHADVVNITDESSSEARLKAAKAYMRISDYEKAEKEYKKVTELAPQNHLGWHGLIDSHTHHYSKRIRSNKELSKLEEYAKTVLTFAPVEEGAELLSEFRRYAKAEQEQNNVEKLPLNIALVKQSKELELLENDNNSIRNDLANAESRIKSLKKNPVGCGWLVFGVPVLVFGIILTNLFMAEGDWFQAKTELAIVFILPCYVLAGLSLVLTIKDKIVSRKNNKEIVLLNSKQKKYNEQISANNEKMRIINNEIEAIKGKLSVYA